MILLDDGYRNVGCINYLRFYLTWNFLFSFYLAYFVYFCFSKTEQNSL